MYVAKHSYEVTDITLLPAGYTARMARLEDTGIAIKMLNAAEVTDIGEKIGTEETLRVEWTSPNFGPETNIHLVFAPDGELAGYAEVWCSDPYVQAHIWGRVHPDHRGQGIGTYLVGWGEARAAEYIDKAPPGSRFSVRVGTLITNEIACHLFEEQGYTLARHFYRMLIEMTPEVPPKKPNWPAEIRVRSFVRNQDERPVYDAVKAAFRDHWGFVDGDRFEAWVHWFENDTNFDPTLWFLAVAGTPVGEQIAGLALCRPRVDGDPKLGWINTLGVLRPWRRRGIATALLRHAFGVFYRRGQYKVGLGVDASSLTGATRLYEKAGMYVDKQSNAYEKVLRPGLDLSTQHLEN